MSDPEISSGSGSDAEQEDAINQKVARVIQPLVKKLRRQAKRIDGLEAALALAETETKERIPALERSVAELRSELSERASKLQADVGDRASLADLARIKEIRRENRRMNWSQNNGKKRGARRAERARGGAAPPHAHPTRPSPRGRAPLRGGRARISALPGPRARPGPPPMRNRCRSPAGVLPTTYAISVDGSIPR